MQDCMQSSVEHTLSGAWLQIPEVQCNVGPNQNWVGLSFACKILENVFFGLNTDRWKESIFLISPVLKIAVLTHDSFSCKTRVNKTYFSCFDIQIQVCVIQPQAQHLASQDDQSKFESTSTNH